MYRGRGTLGRNSPSLAATRQGGQMDRDSKSCTGSSQDTGQGWHRPPLPRPKRLRGGTLLLLSATHHAPAATTKGPAPSSLHAQQPLRTKDTEKH